MLLFLHLFVNVELRFKAEYYYSCLCMTLNNFLSWPSLTPCDRGCLLNTVCISDLLWRAGEQFDPAITRNCDRPRLIIYLSFTRHLWEGRDKSIKTRNIKAKILEGLQWKKQRRGPLSASPHLLHPHWKLDTLYLSEGDTYPPVIDIHLPTSGYSMSKAFCATRDSMRLSDYRWTTVLIPGRSPGFTCRLQYRWGAPPPLPSATLLGTLSKLSIVAFGPLELRLCTDIERVSWSLVLEHLSMSL